MTAGVLAVVVGPAVSVPVEQAASARLAHVTAKKRRIPFEVVGFPYARIEASAARGTVTVSGPDTWSIGQSWSKKKNTLSSVRAKLR